MINSLQIIQALKSKIEINFKAMENNQTKEQKIKKFDVSEFEFQEIDAGSAKEMIYKDTEVFFGGSSPHVKTIHKKGTNQVDRVMVFNGFHFNVFNLSEDKSRLNYEFSGKIKLPSKIGNNYFQNNKFDPLSIEGGDLFLKLQKQQKVTSVWNPPKKKENVYWVNMEGIKEGEIRALVCLEGIELNAIEKTQLERLVEPYRAKYVNQASTLYFFVENQLNEATGSLDHNLYNVGNISSSSGSFSEEDDSYHLRKLIQNPKTREFSSKTIMKLFSSSIINQSFIIEKMKNDREKVMKEFNNMTRLNFKSFDIGLKALRVSRLSPESSPSRIYSILVDSEFFLISILDLKSRRVLKSAVVTAAEISIGIVKLFKTGIREYIVVNAFYNHEADKVCLVLNIDARMNQGLVFAFVEVDGVFHQKNRAVSCQNISKHDEFLVNEQECSILFRDKISTDLTKFELHSYRSAPKLFTTWKIDKKSNNLGLSDLERTLKSCSRLDANKLLYTEEHKLFIFDTKKNKVLEKKKYSHLPIDHQGHNILACDEYILVSDYELLAFEMFSLDLKNSELSFRGDLSFSNFQRGEIITTKSEGLNSLKRMNNRTFLITSHTKMLRGDPYDSKEYIRLMKIDPTSKPIEIKETLKIKMSWGDDYSYEVGVSANDQVIILGFSRFESFFSLLSIPKNSRIGATKIFILFRCIRYSKTTSRSKAFTIKTSTCILDIQKMTKGFFL